MAKKRCRRKGRRRCLSALNRLDPLAIKLNSLFVFNGRMCQEVIRQATAGIHQQTSIVESVGTYFQPWIFGPKFNGGNGTFYSINLPDSGWFQFENSLIPDTGLLKELAIVARFSLRDDGDTLTPLHLLNKQIWGSAPSPFDITMPHGGNPSLSFTRSHGTDSRVHNSAFNLNFEENYTLGVNAPALMESDHFFYKDGQKSVATKVGTGTGAPTGISAPIRIGRRNSGATSDGQFRGRIERIMIFERNLSDGEMWQLKDDPDVVFTEDDYISGVVTAAAVINSPFSSTVRFTSSVGFLPFFNSEVHFASTFRVLESRGSINSSVRFASKFTACIASDIYGYDTGDAGRYRR